MEEQQLPKITILLATYNRANLIGETLLSIQEQTYKNWECLIVDDHSNDDTFAVIQEFIKEDPRFFYHLKTDKYKKGLSGTRNYGLDIAKERDARFIQFFDDDDLMHPQKLELQLKPFLQNPNLNFTVCKFEKLIEVEEGKSYKIKPDLKLKHTHIGDAILTGKFRMNNLGPLWNMQIINKFRFDEGLSYAEEWELFIRLGYQFPGNYEIIDEYLFVYRKHPKTLTFGEDKNFERRKTSAIIRIKILEYLTKNRLHTKTSVKFLAETFLIKTYNPNLVDQLKDYSKQNKLFSYKFRFFLNLEIQLTKRFRKIILKINTWA